MVKRFDPDMCYNVAVFDFDSEIEVRFYSSAVLLPGYGFAPGAASRWEWDSVVECPFIQNQYGEDMDVRLHDLDEVLLREERSRYNSMARTVNKVYSIARSYPWEWFCTFTFSPAVVDRYDYSAVSALMSLWLKLRRRQSADMMYVVVPELHKDGAFHFHGLFARCASALLLCHFKGDEYEIRSFRYGFSKAVVVANSAAASRYISKYITKDLCAVSAGKRRYWASRNVSAPSPACCMLSPEEKKQIAPLLLRSASYNSLVSSPVGDVEYFYFKKDDVPEDVMRFLKLHAVTDE